MPHFETREQRVSRMQDEARRAVLSRWLDALPEQGWEGSSSEIEDELNLLLTDEEARWVSTLQPGRLLADLADLIVERGWWVEPRRTATARLYAFTRD